MPGLETHKHTHTQSLKVGRRCLFISFRILFTLQIASTHNQCALPSFGFEDSFWRNYIHFILELYVFSKLLLADRGARCVANCSLCLPDWMPHTGLPSARIHMNTRAEGTGEETLWDTSQLSAWVRCVPFVGSNRWVKAGRHGTESDAAPLVKNVLWCLQMEPLLALWT